jgi:hypothetical protein
MGGKGHGHGAPQPPLIAAVEKPMPLDRNQHPTQKPARACGLTPEPNAHGRDAPARPDRGARFLARLDTHLSTLSNDSARATFIDRQLEGWQRRYGRFIATQGASEPVTDCADPPHAADFMLAITALAARRKALGRSDRPQACGGAAMTKVHAPMPVSTPMASPYQDKLLASALFSLLVAVDQRCPAIIGQAHLLYHGTRSKHAETTFAQLKRDTDDLVRAIAKVEAVMKPPQPDIVMR